MPRCVRRRPARREVWLIESSLPLVTKVGTSCGPSGTTLGATPPILGRTMTLHGRAPAPSIGLLLLSVPGGSIQPLLGCGFFFDPLTSLLLPHAIPSPDWQIPLAVPNSSSLLGRDLIWCDVALPPPPRPFELSRQLVMRMGAH